MQQRPGCCVSGMTGVRSEGKEGGAKANHETRANKAAIRNSKLLSSLEEARFVRPGIS